jgi:CheY-like chemotaxis protein
MPADIKVLIIDDEFDFCYFVKKNLSQSGPFDVLIATSGTEGIDLAEKEEPDIILLDLFMPDMPGEDVAEALRKNPVTKDIPILFVTALASNNDICDSEEHKMGKNHIMPKPVRTKKLIETIMKILSKA